MTYIDDIAHVLWGILIVLSCVFLPPVVAAVVIMIPREAEQTKNALPEVTWTALREHVSWDWALGKVRDLAGFALGAFLVQLAL